MFIKEIAFLSLMDGPSINFRKLESQARDYLDKHEIPGYRAMYDKALARQELYTSLLEPETNPERIALIHEGLKMNLDMLNDVGGALNERILEKLK